MVIQRRDYLNSTTHSSLRKAQLGSTKHGVTSVDMPSLDSLVVHRVFRPYSVRSSVVVTHTIAGAPSAPLESACGHADRQPPQFGRFSSPNGLAGPTPYLNINQTSNTVKHFQGVISDVNYLYIADRANHVIRGLSAVCTFICENGGRCVASDTCDCPVGWAGIDCTTPTCTNIACGANQVIFINLADLI